MTFPERKPTHVFNHLVPLEGQEVKIIERPDATSLIVETSDGTRHLLLIEEGEDIPRCLNVIKPPEDKRTK